MKTGPIVGMLALTGLLAGPRPPAWAEGCPGCPSLEALRQDPMALVELLGAQAFADLSRLLDEALAEKPHTPHLSSLLAALELCRHPAEKEFWIRRLKDPGTLDPAKARAIRLAGVEILSRYRKDDSAVRAIADSLFDEERAVSEAAASALHWLRHPAALPALMRFDGERRRSGNLQVLGAIADTPGEAAAAYALGKLGQKRLFEGRQSGKVYELSQEYMPWWGLIARKLALRKDKRLLPILTEAVKKAVERGSTLVDDGFYALGLLGDRAATPVLMEAVRKLDFHNQYWAALALARLGDPAALPALREALPRVKDLPASRPWVNRSAIAYALARLGDASGERALLEQEKDPEEQASMYALLGLLRLRGLSYAQKILERLRPYRDIDKNLHYPMDEIAEAIAELATPGAARILLELTDFVRAGGIGHHAEIALREMPAEVVARAVAERLRSGGWKSRNLAAARLMSLPLDPYPTFAALLQDGDLPARVLAVRLLGRYALPRFRPQLERALQDPAWQVADEARLYLAGPTLAALAGDRLALLPEESAGWSAAGPAKDARRLLELSDGRVAVAAADGVWIYDGMQWRTLTTKDGLCAGEVQDIALVDGALAAASGAGVAVERAGKFECQAAPVPPTRLASGGKRFYLGTERGMFEFASGKFSRLPGPERPVRAVAVDGRGAVWAVFAPPGKNGPHSLFAFAGGKAEEISRVFRSYRGKPQDVWTRAGRATFRETFAIEPFSLLGDAGGGVWISTGTGLLRVERGRTRPFPPEAERRSPIPPGAIAGEARRLVVGYPGFIEIIEGQTARRAFFDDNTRRLLAERGLTAGPLPAGALLSRSGEVWLALPYAVVTRQGHGAVLRLVKKDPARAGLPPETIIARVSGGAFFQDNPDIALSGQNLERKFAAGEVVKIPANVVSVSAVAKDPWDFGPVQLRFKLDERPWTEWSDANLLITPDILDEGVHRVLAQARDADGNVDPTPAELRFTVVTRDVTVIRVRDGQFERVFPSQFLRYQKGEVGRVELENTLPRPVEVEVKLSIEDLFESPATARATLGPNEKRWLSLPGPFTARVLENRAQRTTQAVVEIAYEHEAARRSARHSFPVEIMEGSAFAWDRPERAASFVSSHDPAVQALGSALYANLAAALPEHFRPSSPLRNLLLGAAAFDALQTAGLSYKPDPARPFSSVGPGKAAVDSVQFPAVTLQRRTGDCDDLSVLYASLLENLNVPSALAVQPGHVLVLLDTGVTAANREVFAGEEARLHLRDGRVWLPIEVTRLGTKDADFSGAWASGALRLAQVAPAQTTTVDVRAAWLDNPPATWTAAAAPALPDLARAQTEVKALSLRFVDRALQNAPAGDDPAALLARGKALLRAGMFEPAAQAFEKALASRESYEAAFGLAATRAGRGELLPAILGFEKALNLSADALQKFQCHMAMAQCYRQNGNTAKARRHLEQATTLNPAARTDQRYRALISFLSEEGGEKAAAEDEPPPFFQHILEGL